MKRAASLANDPVLRLVDRIYQGAVDPRAWPSILRDTIAYVGGSKGVLVTHFAGPQEGGFAFLHAIPESFLEQWATRYMKHDLWAEATARKGHYREGNVVLDQDLVAEEEFYASVFYREFLKPQGIARLCGGIVFGRETAGTLPTACSVYRDVTDRPFGERERKRMMGLVPHLSRALGVMYRLRDAELKAAATLAALDRLASGIALLDASSGLVHFNRLFEEVIESNDGLALQAGSHTRLRVGNSAAQAALDASIASIFAVDVAATAHFSESVLVPRPSGKPPFVLQCAPLPEANSFAAQAGTVRGILFLTDPGRKPAPKPELLKRLYGISPAEARLAVALCGGETLLEAAHRCLITEATARTQLKSIFDKTGTHRQADLVRLLVSLASDT